MPHVFDFNKLLSAAAKTAKVCSPATWQLSCASRRDCPPKSHTCCWLHARGGDLKNTPWIYRDEMVWEEHGIQGLTAPIISCLLKQTISFLKSFFFWTHVFTAKQTPLVVPGELKWVDLRADQLVCIDKASFDEQRGWRKAVWFHCS